MGMDIMPAPSVVMVIVVLPLRVDRHQQKHKEVLEHHHHQQHHHQVCLVVEVVDIVLVINRPGGS